MADRASASRLRFLILSLVCVSTFFVGGFYGCQLGTRDLERFGRKETLNEIVYITQGYLRGWHDDGRWPRAEDVVYSDLLPVGSRVNAKGERIDQFPSPFGGSELMEFHLSNQGFLRVELRPSDDAKGTGG